MNRSVNSECIQASSVMLILALMPFPCPWGQVTVLILALGIQSNDVNICLFTRPKGLIKDHFQVLVLILVLGVQVLVHNLVLEGSVLVNIHWA